jgi:hypothetical protein
MEARGMYSMQHVMNEIYSDQLFESKMWWKKTVSECKVFSYYEKSEGLLSFCGTRNTSTLINRQLCFSASFGSLVLVRTHPRGAVVTKRCLHAVSLELCGNVHEDYLGRVAARKGICFEIQPSSKY